MGFETGSGDRKSKNYWICVTSPHNWSVCKANRLWGAKEAHAFQGDELIRAGIGDILLIHVTVPFAGEVAVAEVRSLPFVDNTRIWDGPNDRSVFPRRVRIEVLYEFPTVIRTSKWLSELVSSGGRIRAVRGATKPQSLLQGKAMILLTREEFEFVYGEIRKVNLRAPSL